MNTLTLRLAVSIFLCCVISNFCLSYSTYNGGNAAGTWTSGSTYYIIGTVFVQDNQTLTVEQGCFVKFAPGAELYIYGTLAVNGSPGNYAYFTSYNDNSVGETISGSGGSPNPGDWKGIYLYGNADYDGSGNFYYAIIKYAGSTSSSYDAGIQFDRTDSGTLDHCLVEYSGYDGIKLYSANPAIVNSAFNNNIRHGIFGDIGYLDANTPTINFNTFTGNGGYGVKLSNFRIQPFTGNTGSGNGINGFGIDGEVKDNVTIIEGSTSFPFIISGKVTVNTNVTFTIPAGSVVKFDTLGELYVYGSVSFPGTAESGIVLTSLKDDSYGGDANSNGSATLPVKGDWKGIYLLGSDSYQGIGHFDYCRIRYAGSPYTSYDACVYFDRVDEGYFSHSICEYSGYDGLNIYSSGPNISNSQFAYNTRHGVFSPSGYMPASIIYLNNNSFLNNGQYGASFSNVYITSYSGNTGSGNGVNGIGIQGSVVTNKVWSTDPLFPIVLTGQVVVNDDITLALDSGAVIKSDPSGEFLVWGTLDVNGTAAYPVVITSLKDDSYGGDSNNDSSASSPAPGDWRGIYLNGNSGNDGVGTFDYCRIRYGGNILNTSYEANIFFDRSISGYFKNSISEYSEKDGLYFYSCAPALTYSSFNHNNRHGIFSEGGYQPANYATINNNTFTSNAQYGVYVSNIYFQSYYGNTGSGNGYNGFGIQGGVFSNVELRCGSSGFPFILIGRTTVDNNYVLTIAPGTIVKSIPAGELFVYGTVDVNGTADSNVVFTSIHDDSYGGDANSNGSASSPAPGDWYGIIIVNPSSGYVALGNFDYTRIRYGGNLNTSYDANIYFDRGGWNGSTFANSISEFSAKYGMSIYDCCPSLSYSTFSSNASHGVFASTGYRPANAPFITNCVFTNNAEYGAYLQDVRPTSYSGNTGSGNGTNALGIYGIIEDTPINWSSGSDSFPISLVGNLGINSDKVLNITGGTLKCNNYCTYNPGGFYLLSGATLDIGAKDGIASSGNSGNIRNGGTRDFSTGANYVYSGTEAQVTGSGLPAQVNGIKVNNSFGVTLTGNLLVNGTLYLANGVLNNTSKGSVIISDNAEIVKESGSLALPVTYSGMVNLVYKGSAPVTTGNEVPSTDIIKNITFDCSGGVSLSQSLRANGTIYLVSGQVISNSNILALGSGVDNLGTLVRTAGRVNGNFSRWFAASSVSNVILPCGNDVYYRPISVTFISGPSSGGTLTAFFSSSDPGSNGLPLSEGGDAISKVASDGFWSVTAGSGLAGGTYKINITAESFQGVTEYSKLHLLKRANSGSNWVLQGVHDGCTGSNSCPVLHRNMLNNFSEFGVGSTIDNPLPAELLSFTGVAIRNNVTLKWTTASEINNSGFDIERSLVADKIKWKKIGFIAGSGNSSSPVCYSFDDKSLPRGLYSYRLKQIDYNGNFKYFTLSKSVEVGIPDKFALSQNYPNPFNPVTKIDYSLPVDSRVILNIFDITGREIIRIINNESKPAGWYTIEFNASSGASGNAANISSGTYFYRLSAESPSASFIQTKKMILIK